MSQLLLATRSQRSAQIGAVASFLAAALLAGFVARAAAQEPVALRLPESTAAAETVPAPLPETGASLGLTLEQLEQTALASNPSVQRAAALVGAARGNWVQVGLRPNPNVGYEGQQLGSGGRAEQHGVLFSQEFVRGGKLQLNRAVADRQRSRLEQELAAQELRVLTDVRVAYYQVLLAQWQINLTNNLVHISGEGSQAVDALFRANEVGRGDVLQAQLETENAQILAQNAQYRHDSAWRSLAAVVGDQALAPQPLIGQAIGPPKEFEFAPTLERLLALSPEIAAASLEVERARLAVQRARVEPIPNVSFQGLVNWQDNGIGGKPDGGVALTVPIPLFNRNQGAISQAHHELLAARQALSQLELDLQNRLAPIFEQYANARNQVERYTDVILPAAQESLELARKMYAAGESNYSTLLTAQRTYSQTHLNYLDAVRSLRIAEVHIEGLLLSGSLQSPSGGLTVPEPATIGASGRIGPVDVFLR